MQSAEGKTQDLGRASFVVLRVLQSQAKVGFFHLLHARADRHLKHFIRRGLRRGFPPYRSQGASQMPKLNLPFGSNNHGTLDYVSQFPHVARP